MSNPSKVAGTRQETRICNVINDFAGSDIAERLALHGSNDQGDIRIRFGGLTLIGESKYSKHYPSEGQIQDFKAQTLTECENYGGDGGLLFVNVPNRSITRMEIWLQRSTHFKLEMMRNGIKYPDDIPQEQLEKVQEIIADSEFSWRRITLFDFLHEYFRHPAWEDRRQDIGNAS